MALKPFIGIKRIWYGDVIGEAVTKTSLPTLIADMTEVKNSALPFSLLVNGLSYSSMIIATGFPVFFTSS